MEQRDLTFEKFEKAFKSITCNKAAGHDDTDVKVIIKVYNEGQPLSMILHSSFSEVHFSREAGSYESFLDF